MDSDQYIDDYLASSRKQFQYYKQLGDSVFGQLSDEQLFWQPDEDSNSISIIVKHLSGNMLSRWTDFLTDDGEKVWRDRDMEFDGNISSREELLSTWGKGWDCLWGALDSINSKNFSQVIYIRNMGHSITEAINRQLSHYAYHIGQIVFIGKMLKGKKWQSLSIPLGASASYNAQKFSQPKRSEHFTSEFLKKS